MSWRCVVIESQCKISTSGNYLIVRSDEVKKIHLTEIYCVMIAVPNVTITGIALCELARRKIKVILCDEKHNPYGEMVSYYGSHNCAKRIRQQIEWDSLNALNVNICIIRNKILNQSALLYKIGQHERAAMLQNYAEELTLGDISNREGHAAKVYFNTLFGNEFNRDVDSSINKALNYGYSILLSSINREIVASGYITQLGINHRNEFNEFNLSCDFIEPFRVVVDEYVYNNYDREFDKQYKYDLVDLLNKRVVLGKEMCLHDAISVSVRSILNCLDNGELSSLCMYEFS